MEPVFFKGHNVVIGKDQPQYRPLPAFIDEKGNVLTEWSFTEEERARIAAGENLTISCLTFGKPFQPIMPYIRETESKEDPEDVLP